MPDFMARLPEHDLLPLLIVTTLVGAGTVISVAIVGIIQWRRYRAQEWAAALVQDMLAKGLSAGEIERLLSSSGLNPQAGTERQRFSLRPPWFRH